MPAPHPDLTPFPNHWRAPSPPHQPAGLVTSPVDAMRGTSLKSPHPRLAPPKGALLGITCEASLQKTDPKDRTTRGLHRSRHVEAAESGGRHPLLFPSHSRIEDPRTRSSRNPTRGDIRWPREPGAFTSSCRASAPTSPRPDQDRGRIEVRANSRHLKPSTSIARASAPGPELTPHKQDHPAQVSLATESQARATNHLSAGPAHVLEHMEFEPWPRASRMRALRTAFRPTIHAPRSSRREARRSRPMTMSDYLPRAFEHGPVAKPSPQDDDAEPRSRSSR